MTDQATRSDSRATVIVNYGSHALLARNVDVDSCRASRVIIVDNFSSAAESAALQSLATKRGWTVVALPKNGGFGRAANAGIQAGIQLGCRTFVLLNPDARAKNSCIEALHKHCENYPMDLAAPIIRDSSGRVVFRGSEMSLRAGHMRALRAIKPASEHIEAAGPIRLEAVNSGWMRWLTGACLGVSRELFERTNGFDESYFLYWEDVDFSVRVSRVGGNIVVRPDLEVVHDEGGTQRKANGSTKSARYYFYNCRNRCIFAAKWLATDSLWLWLKSTPRESWEIVRRGGYKPVHLFGVALVSASWGVVAGLWRAGRVRALSRQEVSSCSAGELAIEKCYGNEWV